MDKKDRVLALALLLIAVLPILLLAHKGYRYQAVDYDRWPVPEISNHPDRTGIPGLREVSFQSDGLKVAGWYAPGSNRAAVVLLHGTQADRSSLLDEARLLTEGGFAILAIDFPGQGASQGRTQWGEQEQHAAAAAVAWLASRSDVDADRIGALGMSLGGYILLQLAAHDTRIRAVALVSTPADLDEETRYTCSRYGLLTAWPALLTLHHLRRPGPEVPAQQAIAGIAPRGVLLASGARDPWLIPGTTQALFGAARDPRQMWIAPEAGHADLGRMVPKPYGNLLRKFFADKLDARSVAAG